MTRTRNAAATLCLLVVASGLAGCSGKSAVCDDVDAIKASMNNIRHAKVGENALSVISTEVTQMKSEVKKLANDAQSQYSTEIANLKTQAAAFKTSLDAAKAQPSAATLADVGAGVQKVGSAVDALVKAASNTC